MHEVRDLSPFTALTELGLHNVSGEISVRQMVKTLGSIRSGNLNALNLLFFEPPDDDWELLHTALEQPRFRCLHDLCIRTTLPE
jgi:hypothetical protein